MTMITTLIITDVDFNNREKRKKIYPVFFRPFLFNSRRDTTYIYLEVK